jgi:hypothetical protein
VRIWPSRIEGFAEPHWEGWCEAAPLPPIGSETDPRQDLVLARRLLPGVMAEAMFAGDHYRLGSSIDETAMAVAIIGLAAMKMGRDPRELFHEIKNAVEVELWAHEPTVRRIADELISKECINSHRLRFLLAGN